MKRALRAPDSRLLFSSIHACLCGVCGRPDRAVNSQGAGGRERGGGREEAGEGRRERGCVQVTMTARRQG